jgi:hypothetical protein
MVDKIDIDPKDLDVVTTGEAEQIIYTWLRRNKGKTVIGEDIRRVVYERGKRLRHPNLWGPLVRKLRDDRWLWEQDGGLIAMSSSKSNRRRSISYKVAF